MGPVARRRFLAHTTPVLTTLGWGFSGGSPRIHAEGTEWTHPDVDAFSTVNDIYVTGDAVLTVGTERSDAIASHGYYRRHELDGSVEMTRGYPSDAQRRAIDQDVQMGPIPQDGISAFLPHEDGCLLCGWTYFDNQAVYIARLIDIDTTGSIRWTRSLGGFDGSSSFSFIEDVTAIDDGYLLCGSESTGISLGGTGWLLSIDHSGSINWHRRVPATDRPIADTNRLDVFTGIAEVDDGYVLSGYFEPGGPGSRTEGWIHRLDQTCEMRWQDRFEIDPSTSTRGYAVVPDPTSDSTVHIVGAVGETIERGRRDRHRPIDPTIEGDGFVRTYDADGTVLASKVIDDTPIFNGQCDGERLVLGGVRNGYGWIGTTDRTIAESTVPSVVTSLSIDRDGRIVAGGRSLADDGVTAWFISTPRQRSIDSIRRLLARLFRRLLRS